jgi:hypothetical protein
MLEAAGYRVNVFEFISLEHTEKNKMISAVRHAQPVPVHRIRAQIAAIKEFYGIREHELERLTNPGLDSNADQENDHERTEVPAP